MLEQVPRRRAAVVGLDAAARGAALRSHPLTEDRPTRSAVIDLPSEGRIQRGGVAKASPTALPTQADLSAALALEDFHAFSGRIEELHNLVHAWVGRPLDMVTTAAFDPLFWALQATVDRAWRLWQQRHPGRPGPPRRSRRCCSTRSSSAFGEVLDTQALGYDYEEDPWRPGAAGLHLRLASGRTRSTTSASSPRSRRCAG